MIKLVQDTIDSTDIDRLVEWLKTYPRLTKGAITVEFEQAFAKWTGTEYAVFVNSGSSANLLMLNALQEMGWLKNNKIVVPSLCWATDLAPVMQLGLQPVLADCNLTNLSVDLNHLEAIFQQEDPAALILVSVLGLSPDMDKIVELCNRYEVILLEDNCESQGTEYKGKKLGNFGLMSSFSTYFGHTMSTIEGGFITTNDIELYYLLLQLRSHGWDRDLPAEAQAAYRKSFNVDEFSALYTFYVPGFNLRSTDLQAYIGLGQLEKVDEMIRKRNENFQEFKKRLNGNVWFPREVEDSFTASFCIPVICDSVEQKKRLVRWLGEYEIECRPLIAGSMGTQPFYKIKYYEDKLPNCSLVDEKGLYVPNHPMLTDRQIEKICDLIVDSK